MRHPVLRCAPSRPFPSRLINDRRPYNRRRLAGWGRGAEAARRMGYRGPITLIGAEPHRRLHRSPARHPPQRGISHPHRHRMGGVPRPLPTPPSSPGRLRPSLRHQLRPRAQLPAVQPPSTRSNPASAHHRDPRKPTGPHHRGRARRLARRSRGPQSQPRRRGAETRPARPAVPPDRHRQPRPARLPRHRRPDSPAPGAPHHAPEVLMLTCCRRKQRRGRGVLPSSRRRRSRATGRGP